MKIQSHPDEVVFVPRYPMRIRAGFVVIPLAFAFSLLIFAVEDRSLNSLFSIAFLGLLWLGGLFAWTRRIRFGPRIYVDRYLLPPREFDYSDIVGFGMGIIKTKRGNISTRYIRNLDELYSILEDFVAKRILAETQIQDLLTANDWLRWAAAAISVVPSVVVSLFLFYYLPIRTTVNARLVFSLYWFPTYLATYALAKWVLKRKSA
jgi:hypothetical protein